MVSLPMRRILVLDDDETVCQVISRMLSPYYEVETCLDPETGIRLAFAFDFDAVIVDLFMPDRDGFEVIAELRKYFDCGILAMTGLRAERIHQQAFFAGADAILVKPFVQSRLLTSIANVLPARGTAQTI